MSSSLMNELHTTIIDWKLNLEKRKVHHQNFTTFNRKTIDSSFFCCCVDVVSTIITSVCNHGFLLSKFRSIIVSTSTIDFFSINDSSELRSKFFLQRFVLFLFHRRSSIFFFFRNYIELKFLGQAKQATKI